MLTEPPNKVQTLFSFQSSELDQNVDLDATKTMASNKNGIDTQKKRHLEQFGNFKIRKIIKKRKTQQKHNKQT